MHSAHWILIKRMQPEKETGCPNTPGGPLTTPASHCPFLKGNLSPDFLHHSLISWCLDICTGERGYGEQVMLDKTKNI